MNSPTSRGLYPEIEPYRTGRLKASDLHEVYYEESGNPNGKPVLFVHGGPGGAAAPMYRRAFDPEAYRIILFDQRGCGNSTPFASLVDNTTWHLVADMELLRTALDIDKWQVFGGSWGSTLSLAYAQTHPGRVSELILRGIFLLRAKELHWFYQEGASYLYPDIWETFLAPIPVPKRDNLIAAYYELLTGDDEDAKIKAARAWSQWEGATLSLIPDPSRVEDFGQDAFAIAFARIECHYFINRGFFDTDDHLLQNISRIRHIPAVVVQGRYDVVTPMRSAWDLHQAWPEADFFVVPDAGHAFSEPGITHELITATDRFRP